MPIGNGKSNRGSLARRVTTAKGVPQNCSQFWGRTAAGRTPAVEPNEPVRGYIKLSNAAKAFNFDFNGKTVLDIGSSTGGFTKYALDNGAKKVIAIEKGTNQMMSPLRFNPRIDLREKTDIFDVRAQMIHFEGIRSAAARGLEREPRGRPPLGTRTTRRVDGSERRAPRNEVICAPDVILADVSFISLTKVLVHAKEYLADKHTEFLVMLKPQFEAKKNELAKGVIKNETIRRNIIKNFEQWLKQNHFVILKKKDNKIKGKTGNLERFYYLMLEK